MQCTYWSAAIVSLLIAAGAIAAVLSMSYSGAAADAVSDSLNQSLLVYATAQPAQATPIGGLMASITWLTLLAGAGIVWATALPTQSLKTGIPLGMALTTAVTTLMHYVPYMLVVAERVSGTPTSVLETMQATLTQEYTALFAANLDQAYLLSGYFVALVIGIMAMLAREIVLYAREDMAD